jgi:methylenetetrahydrofolate dehydrogenase (NADP+)/methenyltetrahydrofolate cyclohydrolase
MTQARIIDGRALAERIKKQVAADVEDLRSKGTQVALHAVLAGEAPGGEIYARSQARHCEQVGIEYKLHELGPNAREPEIIACLRALNEDDAVTGILLLLPLPAGIDTPALQYVIDPYKDVEGVNPANIGLLFYDTPIMAPCTALAVMEVLKEAGCPVRGQEAVVVGQGEIAGRPISLMLVHEGATVVSCHVATQDVGYHTRHADILVVAVGKARLIRGEHVKPGAVVIDVGINRITDEQGEHVIVGDVAYDEVEPLAGTITPVPGGVGPVTVAVLLSSAVEAARQQHDHRRRAGV